MMFEHHLFISYAHRDNTHPDHLPQGWIDLLHERLMIRLGQLLGEKPDIWRDPKLQGNDYFDEKIRINLSQSALFIGVLSPSYIKSEWCLRELQEFHDRAVVNGGLRIHDKSRIFKVLKTPVTSDEQPQRMCGVLGYEFFGVDPATGRFREFNHGTGVNHDPRYWDKLEDLAQDIKELIGCMGNPQPPIVKPSGKTIYLAETTSDLSEDRDRIKRELQLNGYRVLPDRPLSLDRRFRDEVKRYVTESHLAVHLIGARYAIIPEGESQSLIELQREMASAHIGVGEFSQVIWMPPGLNSTDERQRKFIEELSNHLNLPSGAMLLQSKLEDLKTFIHERLNPPAASQVPAKADGSNSDASPALIYIICDQPDYEAVGPIESCLFEAGFDIVSLPPDASPKMHRQLHWDYLRECDAVLTYCGNTTDGWLQMKRLDLLKLPGKQRTKPMLARAFYLGGPPTSGKGRFKVQGDLLIRNYSEFTCDLLKPFIAEINSARGRRS